MGKSVYNGQVIGFTVGRLVAQFLDVINIQFKTQEEAESYCESMNDLDSLSKYFPVKLQALSNSHAEDPSYD